MKYRGINLENVKNNNRSAILHILNNSGAMSRKDIAEKTGLTAASVTLICTELLEEGIIVELGEAVEEKRAGRKKILVDINPDYRHILCISIESDETCISVTNCKGTVEDHVTLVTEKGGNAEEFLDKVAAESTRMLWDLNISKLEILGAAVSVPGKVNRKSGTSINTFSIWTWPVPVADILTEKLGIPVIVENNLKTSAECEILFGNGKEENNFVLLKWGPGVGSAIVIDRRIYRGNSNLSGEIGHMTLGKGGRLCNCGCRGCLETEISTHAIIRDIKDKYKDSPEEMEVLGRWFAEGNEMTYKNVDCWASLDDPLLQDIITEKIDMLAMCMKNYKSLTDPGKVILMGYIFEVEGFFDRFISAYKEYESGIADCFFVKSETAARKDHIEPLAVAMNEWFF